MIMFGLFVSEAVAATHVRRLRFLIIYTEFFTFAKLVNACNSVK